VSGHPHQRIDRDELHRLVDEEQAQLVEVLSKSAFEALHLPGAINLPLSDIDRDRLDALDGTRPIVVYCYDYQ